ncbi:MAG: ATP-dependent DNA helicase PcrA, partial [Lachnospiraceae bacterium]|nr:ATP-dependent DNA helicase PcrA [Lachnospiraceae bacterium]
TEGDRIHFRQFDTAYEEAEYIAGDVAKKKRKGQVSYGDCAVLYRTNAQSRLLEERFIMEGIPYDVIGGTNFYARREIKDVLAYLKTIDNGRDDVAVKRIINLPRRGIGATTILRVQEYADERNISFYAALREAEQIMTIGRSAVKLKPFVTMIQSFRSKTEFFSLEELVKDVLEPTGYLKELEESDEEDAADRIENIQELVNKVVAFEAEHDEPTLSEFLEEVALVADIDRVEGENDRVLLMTLHSAKGLEFRHIYLAGMEDGVFPSYMTITSDDPLEIEEERRLAYVGITRAREDLTLTYARQRMIRGETQYNPVSRFVREIPALLMDNTPLVPKSRERETYQEDSREQSRLRTKPYAAAVKPIAPVKPYAASPSAYTAREKPMAVPVKRGAGKAPLTVGGNPFGTGNTVKSSAEPVPAGRLGYAEGDRVRHARYGEGTVMKIEPGPRDSQVTVVFDEMGQKIMYAGFAKLQKV